MSLCLWELADFLMTFSLHTFGRAVMDILLTLKRYVKPHLDGFKPEVQTVCSGQETFE